MSGFFDFEVHFFIQNFEGFYEGIQHHVILDCNFEKRKYFFVELLFGNVLEISDGSFMLVLNREQCNFALKLKSIAQRNMPVQTSFQLGMQSPRNGPVYAALRGGVIMISFRIFFHFILSLEQIGQKKAIQIANNAEFRETQIFVLSVYYYIMSCQHGEKISKFCISEGCHHKESAGCEYCMRKYHLHLADITLLTEEEASCLVKTLTLPTDIKYRARNLQEAAVEYLKQVKYSLNNWIEQAQKSIIDGLSHATLYRRGFLSTYERLRKRQYRKINAKQLKAVNEYAKSVQADTFKKQECNRYYEQVDWTMKLIAAASEVASKISKLPQIMVNVQTIQQSNRAKVDEIYESIKQEKERRAKMMGFQKNLQNQVLTLQLNPMLKQVDSYQKVDNHQIANENKSKEQSSPIFNNLIYQEAQKRPNHLDNQQQERQLKNGGETPEDRRKRLRRRRSSIDDKLDLKFAAMVDEKAKAAKKEETQKLAQGRVKLQFQTKDDMKEQIEKQELNQESFIIKLIDSNAVKKTQEVKRQDLTILHAPKDEHSKVPEKQKQDVCSNKSSEINIMGVLDILIDNILPPLPPPAAPKNYTHEPIFQKVIKIPVTTQVADDIQSPIYKTRKRQNNKNLASGQLGLTVSTKADKAQGKQEQKSNQALFAIAEKPLQEQGSAVIMQKIPQLQAEQQMQKSAERKDPKQEDLIHLQINQKNSLLLFCQALKSPGDRAIQLLNAALKYSPQNLSASEYLSYLYIENKKAKECLQVCQNVLVHLKNSPQEFDLALHLHNNKAAALNMLGRYSESILILEKCLRYRKKPYFYKNLADAYFSLGIHEKAAMYYQKAIIMDPHYDEAFYNLSVTQFFQQQYSSAQLNIGKALQIQPTNEVYMELSKQIEWRSQNLAI